MQKLYLEALHSVGDMVVLSAAIRDLTLNYPDKYEIHLSTRCHQLFEHNPLITYYKKITNNARINLNYASLMPKKHDQPHHMVGVYHKLLEKHLKIPIPLLKPHGDLYLPDELVYKSPVDGNYWLIMAGGKNSWKTKLWPAEYWQQTVNELDKHGINVVQTGHKPNHEHISPSIECSLDLNGWGGLQELLWLIYHCDGIICGITSGMHIAACFNKPCVVLAGGKESVNWEHYSNDNFIEKFGNDCESVRVEHRFLNIYGELPCCNTNTICWKRDLDENSKKARLCSHTDGDYARCMTLIKPETVVDAVLSYKTGDNMPKNKNYTRTVAISPAFMIELDSVAAFRSAFPELHKEIKTTLKKYNKCCRTAKDVLAYNNAWNDIKIKITQFDDERKKKLKELAEVKKLVVNWNDEAKKSHREVL